MRRRQLSHLLCPLCVTSDAVRRWYYHVAAYSKKPALPSHVFKDHLEAINHRDALEYVRELAAGKKELTESVLFDIHSLNLRGIDLTNAGRYRTDHVRISGSRHVCPNPLRVPDLIKGYFEEYAAKKDTEHPLLFAADIHQKLVGIHPFIDGNGRTAPPVPPPRGSPRGSPVFLPAIASNLSA